MYKNARASHAFQPILSKILNTSNQPQVFTVMHEDAPAFFLLPWTLYNAFRSKLLTHGYTDTGLMEAAMLGIADMARRFLSFPKLEAAFQTEYDTGPSQQVFILKRNRPVGALVRYEYYMSLLAFLQGQQGTDVTPFLVEEDGSTIQHRLLSLVELRNYAMQLPYRFAEERNRVNGDLPFVVTRKQAPTLAVLSWETWKRLMHLCAAHYPVDSTHKNRDLLDRLLSQLEEMEQFEPAPRPGEE